MVYNDLLIQTEKAKMKYYCAVALGLALVLMNLSCNAGVIDDLNFCKNDKDPPASLKAVAAKGPDGEMRGMASAADLYQRAVGAAKAGKDEIAIDWIVLCQWHNPPVQAEIRLNKEQVLGILNKENY
ncbi:hypothetical protein MKK70_00180 [Methylobacterium sp. E-041]|uniref:hypothetical protein n=1 Tax=Methylobacterium sp. E-041 TaxID=2836573 RepID=UPI001FBB0CC9|nr:hypothetical protein [Methylobacterium sp. E-041]MCJ2103821.1 hypothetical protein [Methylobacterium sp. E-041]